MTRLKWRVEVQRNAMAGKTSPLKLMYVPIEIVREAKTATSPSDLAAIAAANMKRERKRAKNLMTRMNGGMR